MTRNGVLSELPTPALLTSARESLSGQHLPTPTATDYKRNDYPADRKRKSPALPVVSIHFPQRYLPTPNAGCGSRGGSHPDKRRAKGQMVNLNDAAVELSETYTYLPTPNTMDSLPVREGEAREKQLHRGDFSSPKRRFMGNLREDIVYETNDMKFGVYEAVVRRWEKITRTAPNPTQPSRTGKPQLAAEFAEWMMGLPEGWVTSEEIGLSRAKQLKAIGNGVCPQQALFALKVLENMEVKND